MRRITKTMYMINLMFIIYCVMWMTNNSNTPGYSRGLDIGEDPCCSNEDQPSVNAQGLIRKPGLVEADVPREEGDPLPPGYQGKRMDEEMPEDALENSDEEAEEDELKVRKPKAIIIGVQKCGTSTLLRFLDLHPDIVACKIDEAHYFDREYERSPEDWYLNLFPKHHKHQIAIEKTPFYFYKIPQVPERILQFNKSMKLIVSVCNPVQRSISSWVQGLVAEGIDLEKHPERTFENMFSYMDPKTKNPILKTNDSLFEFGIYVNYLLKWYDYFPKDQIHLVNGETFKTDPMKELRKVEEFLDIGHKIPSDSLYFDQEKGFYCMNMTRRGEERHTCMSDKKGREHPPVHPGLISQMKHLFRPYNRKLGDISGNTFRWF